MVRLARRWHIHNSLLIAKNIFEFFLLIIRLLIYCAHTFWSSCYSIVKRIFFCSQGPTKNSAHFFFFLFSFYYYILVSIHCKSWTKWILYLGVRKFRKVSFTCLYLIPPRTLFKTLEGFNAYEKKFWFCPLKLITSDWWNHINKEQLYLFEMIPWKWKQVKDFFGMRIFSGKVSKE